jgi:cobalt-zinc-cadmium resistance protein CzcA
MIDKIIALSIRNRLTVILGVLIIAAWGGYSLTKLPIDAVPDITNNQVEILVNSPNLGPLETERFLTVPIEMAMSNIQGLTEIRSISKFGLSDVTLVFTDETDLYWARSQVFERLKAVDDELPEGFGTPFMAPITSGLGEIFQYVVRPENENDTSFSSLELRTIQDWIIRKKLLGTEGIADISSFGGYKKEYQVRIKPDRLRATNVSMEELFQAIDEGNGNTGGAYIEKDKRAYVIRGIGLVKDLDDIENMVIKINNDVPVLVKDVADINIGGSIRYGAMTMNGKGEVVGGVIMMRKGENGSRVIQRIKEKIELIKEDLPEGLIIEPFIDREKLVTRTISTVATNLLEGAVIVIVVLFLFLGDITASLIVASLIPLCMLFAFGMMVQFKVVGNLMSLGALDFGLIVDGSVIVVESVIISLGLYATKKLNPSEREEVILEAVKGSKKSVFFGGLIILIVYFPLLTLDGIEGRMFVPMAITVSFAIIGALIFSLTYVPMMSAWLMKGSHHENSFSDRMVHFLYRFYKPMLTAVLRKKIIALSILVVLTALSVYTFSNIGGEFIPKLDEGDIAIETRLPVGSALSQTIETSKKIETALLKEFPDEIERIVAKIGTSEIPTDPMPLEAMDLIISMKPKEQWKKVKTKAELTDLIAQVFEQFPGLTISIQQPIENRFNELLSGSKTDVVFKLFGTDLDKMTDLGTQILEELSTIEGAKDVQMQQIGGLPQIKIEYDRQDLAFYGIKIDQVNNIIETAFAGKTTGIVYEDDRRYGLVMRLATDERNKLETVKNILIKDYKGNMIPLKELADITTSIGPTEIRHYNKQRCLQIGVNVRGRDIETLVKEADQKIKQHISLPYGYSIEYGGQFENLKKAKERLQIVVPLALIIIIGLLFATFGTFKDSILIFTAVPLSAIGGIFALYIRGITFSISAGVGFIALFGVAVLNGIMLVGHFKLLEKQGLTSIHRIVIQGVKEKFRPVLMTSLVAALGFLPMAVSQGAGAEVQKPLATVVIGGLLVATFLTLLILPIFYVLASRIKGSKKPVPVLIAIIAFGMHGELFAQNLISKQKAVEMSLQNHPLIRIAEGKIDEQKALKPAAYNFYQPQLLFEAPTGEGLRPGLHMMFDFPSVYVLQSKAQNTMIEGTEYQKKISKNELVYTVLNIYCQLQFLVEKEKVLTRQDSLFSKILEINQVRYDIGQISNLDKVNSEANYKSLHNKLMQIRIAKNNLSLALTRYLGNDQSSPYLPDSKISKLSGISSETDMSTTASNPTVNYYENRIKYSNHLLKAEKHRAIPGLAIGYLHQGSDPNKNLGIGVRLGLQLPLFFWINNARIKSLKKSVEVSQNEKQLNDFNLNTSYIDAISQYNQYLEMLNYYDETGLLQSVEVLKTAGDSYTFGTLSYYAYLQNIEKAFEIELNYLDAINNYNQAVLRINLLTGRYQDLEF